MTVEQQISTSDLAQVNPPAGPVVEGTTVIGALSVCHTQIAKYLSNSSEAVPFELTLTLDPEFGGTPEVSDPPYINVAFYRGEGVTRELVTALVLKCTIEVKKSIEGGGGKVVLKFTSHAVAGLKKGETLVIVITG